MKNILLLLTGLILLTGCASFQVSTLNHDPIYVIEGSDAEITVIDNEFELQRLLRTDFNFRYNQWGNPYGWNNYYGWNNGFYNRYRGTNVAYHTGRRSNTRTTANRRVVNNNRVVTAPRTRTVIKNKPRVINNKPRINNNIRTINTNPTPVRIYQRPNTRSVNNSRSNSSKRGTIPNTRKRN